MFDGGFFEHPAGSSQPFYRPRRPSKRPSHECVIDRTRLCYERSDFEPLTHKTTTIVIRSIKNITCCFVHLCVWLMNKNCLVEFRTKKSFLYPLPPSPPNNHAAAIDNNDNARESSYLRRSRVTSSTWSCRTWSWSPACWTAGRGARRRSAGSRTSSGRARWTRCTCNRRSPAGPLAVPSTSIRKTFRSPVFCLLKHVRSTISVRGQGRGTRLGGTGSYEKSNCTIMVRTSSGSSSGNHRAADERGPSMNLGDRQGLPRVGQNGVDGVPTEIPEQWRKPEGRKAGLRPSAKRRL